MLPIVHEDRRIAPDAFFRSALFGIISKKNNSGARTYYKNKPIACWSGAEISFTGEELGQDDLDVYLGLIHLIATNNYIDGEIKIKTRGFLNFIGRSPGGKTSEWFNGCLTRLKANEIKCEWLLEGFTYRGSLIDHVLEDHNTGLLKIQINKKLLQIFEFDGIWTTLDYTLRKQLKIPMSKWLHAFLSGYTEQTAIPLKLMQEQCRAKVQKSSRFVYDLKKAATEVEKAAMNSGMSFEWSIVDGYFLLTTPLICYAAGQESLMLENKE